MILSGLPLLLFPRLPKSLGILSECTVTTKVSRVLNLEFDWETLKYSPYHVSRQLIFASKNNSYHIIVLLYTILNRYAHHVAIAHVL